LKALAASSLRLQSTVVRSSGTVGFPVIDGRSDAASQRLLMTQDDLNRRFARSAASFSSSAIDTSTVKPVTLVKIGAGEHSIFPVSASDLGLMDRMALLKALLRDEGFKNALKDVDLTKCKVAVGQFTGDEPTAEEEIAAQALKAAKTIGELEAGKGQRLFIRITLPGPQAVVQAAAG
jgi:hypothetical protein